MSTGKTYTPEETKRRLIAAGLKLFGRAGRDGVSTRELAAEADTSLHAIQYHFGGKDEVYLAVARYLVETTGVMARQAAMAARQDIDRLSAADAGERAAQMMRAFVGIMIAMPDAPARGGFMLREQLSPTEAFEIVYSGFVEPAHTTLTLLVARATGLAADDPVTITRAHALFGQALAFGSARETLNRRLGTKLTAKALAEIAGQSVADLTRAALATGR